MARGLNQYTNVGGMLCGDALVAEGYTSGVTKGRYISATLKNPPAGGLLSVAEM